MECKKVGFLRARILEAMAKYIGVDDIGYVVANVISEARIREIECKITNANLDGTYILSIKLLKEKSK